MHAFTRKLVHMRTEHRCRDSAGRTVARTVRVKRQLFLSSLITRDPRVFDKPTGNILAPGAWWSALGGVWANARERGGTELS